MATIIYTKSNSTGITGGTNDLVESAVKVLIEHENDKLSAESGICDKLFNVEDSDHYAETLVNHSDLGTFSAVSEGSAAAGLSAKEYARKVVEHIQFMGEFGISANMLEDAGSGIAADSRRLIRGFVRSYYRTRNKLAEKAIINGTAESMSFNSATVDLKTADGKTLFSNAHVYGDSGSQSNYYYKAKTTDGETVTAATIETLLSQLAVKMRNLKDEDGEVLGFEPDIILIPGDNPTLETAVKKAVLSVNACGGSDNDANLQYGKWQVIVLPDWSSSSVDSFIIMSSEANRALGGNMFFNRIPLTVKSWEDYHTGNHMWNGRCRFGVGFGSYKHIMRFDYCAKGATVSTATALS